MNGDEEKITDEQHNPSIPDDYRFEINYLKHMLDDSAMPPISQLKPLFERATKEEFISVIQSITDTNDRTLFEQLLYYMVLFRDMTNVQEYLNDPDVPVSVVEKLILYTHGHCALKGYSVESVLDEVLYFLKPKRLLALLLESSHISRDKLFSFFILTKLDRPSLDIYFSKKTDVEEIIKAFMKLPRAIMKSIITRNYRLFQYIMLMLVETGSVDEKVQMFYENYRNEIEELSRLSDVIRKYKKQVNLEEEKTLPFDKRNMARISFLVNKIREMHDPEKALSYFEGEKVFADEDEKDLLREIVTNPLFKETFLVSYDTFFSAEQ